MKAVWRRNVAFNNKEIVLMIIGISSFCHVFAFNTGTHFSSTLIKGVCETNKMEPRYMYLFWITWTRVGYYGPEVQLTFKIMSCWREPWQSVAFVMTDTVESWSFAMGMLWTWTFELSCYLFEMAILLRRTITAVPFHKMNICEYNHGYEAQFEDYCFLIFFKCEKIQKGNTTASFIIIFKIRSQVI